jgi:hypothetical protein
MKTTVAQQLEALNAKRILITAAEKRNDTILECAMDECFCPYGPDYFDVSGPGSTAWMPTNDHHPILKCEGGKETVENSRLAHRLCNRVDYSKRARRSWARDLARVESAYSAWVHSAVPGIPRSVLLSRLSDQVAADKAEPPAAA